MNRRASPDLLLDDPFARTATGAEVDRFCDGALAHGQALAAEIRALAGAPAADVNFEATLGRLDEIRYTLRLAKGVCQLLVEVHPDTDVRDAARSAVGRAEALETELFLDPEVAAAIKTVAARAQTGPQAGTLDAAHARLLAHALRELRRNGLDLPPAEQEELRRLNAEISRASQDFDRNLTDAQASITVPRSALEGLPPEYVAAHEARALPDGSIEITTDYPDFFPFVRHARDREAARALYAAFDNRAAAENVPLLERLLALRERKAKLLGYASWADYAIEPRMARTPATVRAFLGDVRQAVAAPAARELAQFRAMHEALGGKPGAPLYPSDRYYLEEHLRAARHGYDSLELANYFEVGAVVQGLLDVTARLFGIQYQPAAEAVPWHPDVRAYDVSSGGRLLGRMFLDLHPRPHKFKHAGAFEVRPAWRAGGATPIAALICNLPRSEDGQPALLSHDEVVVLFHELGHVLHQLLSDSPFATFAGEAVARDFVEAPSQVFEEWAFRREVLDLFARHHQTGAKIPTPLYEALTRARDLGLAVSTQVQLFLAALDLEYHSRPAGFDSTAAMREIFAEYQPFAFIEGTHYQATFTHLVGYDAGYYGYQWARSLAHDVLTRFERDGFLNPELAARWRSAVLARGGSEDEERLLESFLGRASSTTAYIEHLQRLGSNTATT